jgi:hypothetical protein
MKNCISLATVCFLMLFASATSLAQKASASPTPQDVIWDPPCPTISVSCPSDREPGKPVEFKATIGNLDPKLAPTYTWEVVGGVIAEGQGTTTITVKLGPKSQSVTATLQVGGLDGACSRTASCTMPIHHLRPLTTKFDSIANYDSPEFNREKERLDLFGAALRQHPGACAYILGYGGRRSRSDAALKAVSRARRYLVYDLGIDQRIVTADGGFKEQLTVDLWLTPLGAVPPVAEPTVDPAEIKSIKTTATMRSKRQLRH